MTKNNESENRQSNIEEGNYNERIEGNYVQGNRNFIFNFRRQGNSEALTPAKHSRIRQALLKQVNLEVESRINSSLHNRVSYIVLDVEQNPEQIELPWSGEIKVGDQPKIRLDNTNIINVFDQSDVAGRLLILGQPGSGKTTMLLKLAEELLKRAKDNSTHPVPVLFSLSSWKNDNQNIKDWLVDQLKDKYGLRNDIGKQWISNQEIIPLLDGLDELVAERQEKCVLKINDFLHPSNWTNPLVVCSRIQEYQLYKTLLHLNSSLELYPFSPQQVEQYLQNTDNTELWDSISHDADLSQLAKTPLLLNIIVLSAQEISIPIWQQFKSSKERLSYLFDAYIRRMLKRPYKDKQPKQENNQRWLSWMAHRLIEESATEFLIEKIQPDCLKNRGQKIIYNLILWGFIGALIFGLIGLIESILGLYSLRDSKLFSPQLVSGIFSRIDNNWYLRIRFVTPLVTDNLIYGLIYGMIYGLIYGLIGNLIENKIEKIIILINPLKKVSKTTISGLIVGLIIGLVIILINGLEYWQMLSNWENYSQKELRFVKQMYGQNSDMSDMIKYLNSWNVTLLIGISLISNLISNLISGLIPGLFFGLIGNKIQTVETLKFSPKKFLNWLKNVLKNWAILGLILGLIILIFYLNFKVILDITKDELNFNVIGNDIKNALEMAIGIAIAIPIFGVFLSFIFKLFSGIDGLEIENKTFPNQGIWQSAINAIFVSAGTFFFTFLIIFGFQIRLKYKINGLVLIDSLSLEVAFGILIGILTCGIPAIKHFILRVILWSSGSIPWNYAKFLNYCTDRLFLQRVGGSYRFMHDLLRQHFAKSYTQISLAPVQTIPVQPSPPPVQNHLVCTNCGHNNLVSSNFCIKCGTQLTKPHI
jgi:GTPase SAR1 family protein